MTLYFIVKLGTNQLKKQFGADEVTILNPAQVNIKSYITKIFLYVK